GQGHQSEECERDPADDSHAALAPRDPEREESQEQADRVLARQGGPGDALAQTAVSAADEDEERVDRGDRGDRGMDADRQQHQRSERESRLRESTTEARHPLPRDRHPAARGCFAGGAFGLGHRARAPWWTSRAAVMAPAPYSEACFRRPGMPRVPGPTSPTGAWLGPSGHMNANWEFPHVDCC